MSSTTFGASLSITFIGTATAILEIDGVNLLTDPFFSPAGREWDMGVAVLKVSDSPALRMDQLPPIDAVLLSHEDHPDNLDEYGRRLLDGRRVLTTMDGATKLAPRPGVLGMKPWETTLFVINGKKYEITATPCVHLPGGECTGFIISNASFGTTDGLPNVIWFAGDTVYHDELKQIANKFHVTVAILNLGAAEGPGNLPLTMGGKDASRLIRDIGADILVPMHYESWAHFTENGEELLRIFEETGVKDRVCWLERGKSKKIL